MVSSKRLSFFPSRKIALSLSKGSELRVATFYDLPGIPAIPPAERFPSPLSDKRTEVATNGAEINGAKIARVEAPGVV
jgi:hypothetical protein